MGTKNVKGGDCSLCRSKKTNKRNCPLNANAKRKNAQKHYNTTVKRKKNVRFNSSSPQIRSFVRTSAEKSQMFNSPSVASSVEEENKKKKKNMSIRL